MTCEPDAGKLNGDDLIPLDHFPFIHHSAIDHCAPLSSLESHGFQYQSVCQLLAVPSFTNLATDTGANGSRSGLSIHCVASSSYA